MADTVAESLAIVLQLEADAVLKTLDEVAKKINGLTGVDDAVGKGDAAAGEIGKVSAAADGAARAQRYAGRAGTAAGKKIAAGAAVGSKAIGAMTASANKAVAALKGMVAPLLGMASIKGSISNYTQQAKALEQASFQARIGVSELDAWRKANEAAGGSAEAFTSAMISFTQKFGANGEAFLRFGERLNSVSDRQASFMLQYMGMSRDAAMIFLQNRDQMKSLVEQYRAVAMNPEDIESARQYRIAWARLTLAAKEVGNVLARSVLPIITAVSEAMGRVANFFARHGRVIEIAMAGVATAIAAVFGPKAIIWGVTKLLSPITALAAAVAALVLVFDDLIGFAQGEDSLFERLLKDAGLSAAEVENLRQAFLGAWAAVEQLGSAAAGAFKGLLSFGPVLSTIKLITAAIGALAAGLSAIITGSDSAAAAFVAALKALGAAWDGWLSSIGDAVAGAFRSAWNAVVDLFRSLVIEPIQALLQELLPASVRRFFGLRTSEAENADLAEKADRRTREAAAGGDVEAQAFLDARAAAAVIPLGVTPTAPVGTEAVAGAAAVAQAARKEPVKVDAQTVVNFGTTPDDPTAVANAVSHAGEKTSRSVGEILAGSYTGCEGSY